MKASHGEVSQRYMVLIKIDAINLLNRIKDRQSEYIEMFSLKRDRGIFKEIFSSRYKKATFFDFSHLPIEIIEIVDRFYTKVDTLYWYLMHTQDMPNAIEDEVTHCVFSIEKKLDGLCLYIDAELGGAKERSSREEIKEQEVGEFEAYAEGFLSKDSGEVN